MPISVQTGGPQNGSVTPPIDNDSLTYAAMVRQISDELDDAEDAYLSQIQAAIGAAVRFCAREPFYFNRHCRAEFFTRAGYACYDRADTPGLAQLGAVEAAQCESGGQIYPLRLETAEQLDRLAANAMMGLPCLYGFYGAKLCLYPIPDKAYRIVLRLNPARQADFSTANNGGAVWFTEAFALIKARAKYDLYKDILKDAPQAAAAFNDFREEWAALAAETSRRAGSGKIRATQF